MFKKHQIIYPNQIPQLLLTLKREVDTCVWHCTATVEGQNITSQEIERWHIKRGFNEIGYNLVFLLNGDVVMGRDWNKIPAHVAGANSKTLGFTYVGGLDKNKKPKDTRTPQQKDSMLYVSKLLKDYQELLKNKNFDFNGHRDYSPDKNGNGIIEPWEWMKACPCFDVKTEIKDKI